LELQDRLSQLVTGMFGDVSIGDSRRPIWSVPADIEETDDAYILDVDVPNVRPEDVDVELNDNELRISGEFRRRERTGIPRRQTRRVGEFEYVIALPGQLDPERVDASLSDGVLTMRVGKASASRARRIQVKGG
jgi:HSP20 family protein